MRQPPHRDGQFTGPGVQPVGGGPAGDGPLVQQGVCGPQRLRGPPVEAAAPVPVVQQPDLPYRLLDGRHLGLADSPLGGQGSGGDGRGAEAEAQGCGRHRGGAARHEYATQHVALLVGVALERGGWWGIRSVRAVGGVAGGSRRPAAYGLARREAQIRQGRPGEHVEEDPFVRVVGTADLAGLHASDVPGVARDLLADLAGGPAYRGSELPGGARSAQPPEGEVGNCPCRHHGWALSGASRAPDSGVRRGKNVPAVTARTHSVCLQNGYLTHDPP